MNSTRPTVIEHASGEPKLESDPATDLGGIKKYLIAGFIVYLLIFVGYGCFAWCQQIEPGVGVFGDAFGALNAFFSGLGFFVLAVAIYLQRQQLLIQSNELRLQREELALTRTELTRTATAQEQTEAALRRQLTIMTLSSRLDAIVLLIREEESHLRTFHQLGQIDSETVSQLQQRLAGLRSGGDPHLQGRDCLIRNLESLISLRTDLASIHAELRKV